MSTKIHLLSAVTLAVLSLAAQAQDADNKPSAALERVEVTGSSIKRLATEEALPVTSIKASEFTQRGITTLADVMMTLPQSISLAPSNAGAGTNINLRGLGVNRTLVLLNGRRLANEAIADGYANLDTIPISALERVEVLNDGASSIYGSDAIGGVVNFITKRSYTGFTATVQAVEPERHGGGEEKRIGFTVGAGDIDKQGWNVFATFDAHRRNRLAASDRAFLSDAAALTALGRPPSAASGGNAFPANVTSTIGSKLTYNPYYATGCLAPYSIQSSKTATCVLDPNNYNTALYGNSQTTFFAKGTLQINPDHVLTAEYTRGDEFIDSVRNPATAAAITTVSPSVPAAVITPTSSKYYPGGSGGVPAIAALKGEALTVNYSAPEIAGTRDNQINQRLVINDEGRIANWDYKAGVDIGISDRKVRLHQGIYDGLKLNQGISNGTINPFSVTQDATGQAYLDSIRLDNDQVLRAARSTFTGVDFTLSRELMAMGGGNMALAIGGDAHRDSTRDDKKAIGTYAVPVAATPTYAESSRKVYALFAELNMPLTKTLTVNLAARDDKYSDFGNTFNPKASFRFQPMASLMFRGSASTGFRAPTLFDRYGYRLPGSNSTTSAKLDDPVLCPSATPSVTGSGTALPGYAANIVCNATQLKRTGSNPDLQPEKSKNYTLGIVVEPVKNATVSLDYWKVTMTDMIANLPESAYLADPMKYLNLFVRDANKNLLYIDNITMNLGGQKVAGLDLSMSYVFKHASMGNFTFGLDGTYLTQFDNQIDKGGPWVSNIGRFGLASNGTTSSFPILSFRWKHNLRVGWQRGDWSTQVTEVFNSTYQDQNTTTVAAANNHVIPSYSLVNWTATYKGFKHITLIAGINNVFDRMPPPTNSTLYSNGYLSSAASPIGRSWNGRITYEY
ncbi:TonB-dependent siderophore receptor [Pelomonas sp. KK5]|uniref:TonB-dependent receptor plug domain-containing protein n=1 Tax=Pelomonas sp. KK5 TaxID=1855730 RepID=UPI00097C0E8B|nr:TonB-dependent receptor [Pelomonas sp. KK5]